VSLVDFIYRRLTQLLGNNWDEVTDDDVLRAVMRVLEYLPDTTGILRNVTSWTTLEGGWRSWDALVALVCEHGDVPALSEQQSQETWKASRQRCATNARAAENGTLWLETEEDHIEINKCTLELAQATMRAIAYSLIGTQHPGILALSRELDAVDL